MSVSIYEGSILDVKADAIINPANNFLRHGGGLARIIDEAARKWPDTLIDYAIDDEFREQRARVEQYEDDNVAHPPIPTGLAGWTSAGRLPYKGIIHAVGPIWGGGVVYEDELLYSAYVSSFVTANQKGCKSVAAPAISAGIFGVPIENVARQAVKAALYSVNVMGLVETITFALMEDSHVKAFSSELALGAM